VAKAEKKKGLGKKGLGKKGLGPRASGLGKQQKTAKKAKKAKPTPTKRKPTKPKPKAAKQTKSPKPTAARKPRPRFDETVQLGEVTVPSGKLAIFDVGLVGFLPRAALEPMLVVADVPRDRALAVVGRRVGAGRFADCWDHVAVRLDDGEPEIATSRRLGEAGVDFARLACMDRDVLDAWKHDDSLDGHADVVFWGRDAAPLAKAMAAPANPEGFGWTDVAVAEAEAYADRAARLKAEHRWLLAIDVRPHSHHFHALAAARASAYGAGTIDVGGARVCLFFTSWGDGVFPIYLDLDHHEQAVQVRVQLNPTGPAAAA
jgi:hypothetical protein